MANTIRIRRRAAGGASGAPSSMANAELAYNEQDDALYYGKGTGGAGGTATSAVVIGGPGAFMTLSTTQTISGDKTFSGAATFNGVATFNSTVAFSSLPTFPVTAIHTFLAGGSSGGAASPSFRAIVASDLPSLDGISSPANDVYFAGKHITNLADPVNAQDAATKAYVDARAAGLDPKQSVRALATANTAVSGAATIDGVTLATGDRVALIGQTSAPQNGLWVVNTSGAWTRPSDWATGNVTIGAFFFVEEGTNWGSTGWVLNTTGNITVGTNGVTFVQFSGAGEITVDGTQLTKSGNTLAIGVIALANGGTGATSAANARTNLGLGSIATQAASSVAITGGSIQNLTTFDGNTIDGGSY